MSLPTTAMVALSLAASRRTDSVPPARLEVTAGSARFSRSSTFRRGIVRLHCDQKWMRVADPAAPAGNPGARISFRDFSLVVTPFHCSPAYSAEYGVRLGARTHKPQPAGTRQRLSRDSRK